MADPQIAEPQQGPTSMKLIVAVRRQPITWVFADYSAVYVFPEPGPLETGGQTVFIRGPGEVLVLAVKADAPSGLYDYYVTVSRAGEADRALTGEGGYPRPQIMIVDSI